MFLASGTEATRAHGMTLQAPTGRADQLPPVGVLDWWFAYLLNTQLFNFLGNMGYMSVKILTSPGLGVLRGKFGMQTPAPFETK